MSDYKDFENEDPSEERLNLEINDDHRFPSFDACIIVQGLYLVDIRSFELF